MTEHVNRADVRERIDRLRADYPGVEVMAGDERLSASAFERMYEDAVEGYTGGGYAWVTRAPADAPALSDSMPDDAAPDRPQVLLVLEHGVEGPAWTVAGGGREDGETYEAAARRELREETAIEASVGRPYLVFYDRIHPKSVDPDVCLHTLWVCFDATYEAGTVAIQASELRGAAWFGSAPTELRPWAHHRGVEWFDDYDPDARWWESLDSLTVDREWEP